MILGDFNVRWDSEEDINTKFLFEILRSVNLIKHVLKRCRRLVTTYEGDDLVMNVFIHAMLSDHFLAKNEVCLERPFFSSTSVSHRNYRFIDINACL